MSTNVRTSDRTTRHRAAWVVGETAPGRLQADLNLGDLRRLVAATADYPDSAEVTVGFDGAKPCQRINVSTDEPMKEATDEVR